MFWKKNVTQDSCHVMSYWLNSAGDLNLDSTLHNLGVSSLSQHGVSVERMIWGEMSQCDHNIGIIRRPQREGGSLLCCSLLPCHDNHHRGAPPLFPMITKRKTNWDENRNSWESMSYDFLICFLSYLKILFSSKSKVVKQAWIVDILMLMSGISW